MKTKKISLLDKFSKENSLVDLKSIYGGINDVMASIDRTSPKTTDLQNCPDNGEDTRPD